MVEMAPERDPLSLVLAVTTRLSRFFPDLVSGVTHATERNSVTQRKLAAHDSPSDVSLTRPPARRTDPPQPAREPRRTCACRKTSGVGG